MPQALPRPRDLPTPQLRRRTRPNRRLTNIGDSTAAWNTYAAPPSASATSPTTSPGLYSRPAASDHSYTAECEEPNNHVVRKHAFHWRYDTPEELALLGELWPLVSMRLNFFTPTKKPIGYSTTVDGRRKRLYDKPRTPWQRVLESGLLDDEQTQAGHARIAGVNPADLTRQINAIQLRLIELSRDKTNAMTTSRHLDMASLEPSIRRLQTTQ